MNTRDFFDWVLTHPSRKKAFGEANDVSIVMHSDKFMKRKDGACVHLIVDTEEKPIVALWCTEDTEKKDLKIHQLLGYRGSLGAAIRAWEQTYPGWTVSGKRLRSGKVVMHNVKDFCKK